MSLSALLLVIAAAILHAIWNLVTKQVGGKLPFFWVIGAMSSVICLPFVVWQMIDQHITLTLTVWMFAGVSALLHIFYFLTLQVGYRKADLSIVYPLARGSGPLISVTGAIIFFNEKPGALALVGVLLIIVGVLIMTGLQFKKSSDARMRAGLIYGSLTGLFIAGYTLWDRLAVVNNHVSGLLITFASMLFPLLLLTPIAIKESKEVKREIRQHWKQALVIAVCQPLSYLLVLVALKTTPLSYVAPTRELSIVFGVFFGTNLLKEADAKKRIIGSLVMLAGIVILALN
ncbi:MAG: DMT family transporter [Sediminibacterium sp.]